MCVGLVGYQSVSNLRRTVSTASQTDLLDCDSKPFAVRYTRSPMSEQQHEEQQLQQQQEPHPYVHREGEWHLYTMTVVCL